MPIEVTVLYSPAPRAVREWRLVLEDGSTVAQALRASGMQQEYAALQGTQPLQVGIWGRRCDENQVLRDQDRVEVYRLLTVDPKMARRTRFVQQGARSAGLFARKRPGAKAGY